ncbi:MAG: protease HtpX [Bacteriovorax sp.]|nr:protease HtpX [Bacteriovorax sp.]
MLKRILLMFAVSLLISITVSIIFSVLGIGHYIAQGGLQYGPLMAFCLVWGMAGSFISLLLSKKIAKWTMGVQIITLEGPHRSTVEKVHRLSRRAGLTEMPEVGIYQSPEVNAFATGRSRNSSMVAVSTGLLSLMDDNEVEGVLAHEVAHIANGDMVTMTLVQGVVNAFVMFLSRVVAFALAQAMKDKDDDRPTNPWMMMGLTMFFDIVFGILATPIVAWFSRYREFRADRGGADLAGKEKMIAALESLQRAYPQLLLEDKSQQANPNFRSMQISSKAGVMQLFSTHPSLELRIAALRKGL